MTSGTPTRMAAWLESAWLARYLDRQLEGEELAWFEAYLLDKPELVETVEVDDAMRDSFAGEPGIARGGHRLDRVRRHTPIFPRRIAAAATVVAALGMGWFGRSAIGPKPGMEAVIADPTRIVYDTTRGSTGSVAHLSHAASASPYVLIEVAMPPSARNVVLALDGQPDVSLEISPDGFVSFLFPRNAMDRSRRAEISYLDHGVTRRRSIEIASGRTP